MFNIEVKQYYQFAVLQLTVTANSHRDARLKLGTPDGCD